MSDLQVLKSDLDGPGIRVLVAEDSMIDLFWLEMVFKGTKLPYTLEIAGDVPAAKNYLEDEAVSEKQPLDLILLDVNLPGPGVGEILDCLASHPQIPTFFLSGCDVPEPLRQRVGRERCLVKPFTNAQLMACLEVVERPEVRSFAGTPAN